MARDGYNGCVHSFGSFDGDMKALPPPLCPGPLWIMDERDSLRSPRLTPLRSLRHHAESSLLGHRVTLHALSDAPSYSEPAGMLAAVQRASSATFAEI